LDPGSVLFSIFYFLAIVPFSGVTVLYAIGHQFTLPETVFFGLISLLGAVTAILREAVGLHLNENLRMPDATLALVNGVTAMTIVSPIAKSITTIFFYCSTS